MYSWIPNPRKYTTDDKNIRKDIEIQIEPSSSLGTSSSSSNISWQYKVSMSFCLRIVLSRIARSVVSVLFGRSHRICPEEVQRKCTPHNCICYFFFLSVTSNWANKFASSLSMPYKTGFMCPWVGSWSSAELLVCPYSFDGWKSWRDVFLYPELGWMVAHGFN